MLSAVLRPAICENRTSGSGVFPIADFLQPGDATRGVGGNCAAKEDQMLVQ